MRPSCATSWGGRALIVLWALPLLGCPAVSSAPCSADEDCPDGRCRRGACGPFCLDDYECGSEQVCRDGQCAPRPECASNADCAKGFLCAAGRCQCTGDSACAANQACILGSCETRPRCRSDEDCAGTGRRCEVTQGLCVPPCALPTDCAPELEPSLATALYVCFEGSCLRRCVGDATCGTGLICAAGRCAVADCETLADCAAGRYCTSADHGRCVEYQVCGSTSECPRNYECRRFPTGECPPGFDCSRAICQELPPCVIDTDCAPPPPATRTSFCDDGHCQPSTRCTASSQCPDGGLCVADLCVPGGCRGLHDCAAEEACVGGLCVSAPAPGDIDRLAIEPRSALLEVGDSLKLTLLAYRLDGSTFPLSSASFAVLDTQGSPSAAATVDSTGLVTALSPGTVVVRGSVPGAGVGPQSATLTLHAAVTAGRRVLTIEAATGAPLTGVKVVGCDAPPAAGPCPSPVEVSTDAAGEALFPGFSGATASFTAASTVERADGLPRYDRMSVVATTAQDVLLPLGENPVHGAAGFNATLSFADVSSTGQYWAGFAALSAGDLPELDLRTLLGEPFMIDLPIVPQRFPVPGSVVLYTSPGFGIPQEVKGRSLGLGQAGRRLAVAFAGRTDSTGALALRSAELLAYAGAMDYALGPALPISHLPLVIDYADVDDDGLCAQAQKCPQGSEEVPDYASFTPLSFRPNRAQGRRTEVVLPNVPAALDTLIVAAVESSHTTGVLPLGFSSRLAGPPGRDGTRPVQPLVLRSGAPYGGAEIGQPGIWAMAASSVGAGATFASGGEATARLTRGPVLPTRVLIPPFLPIPTGSSFSPATRTFSPGQPAWSSAYSSGGDLARLVLTGSQGRHVVYFRIEGSQTSIRVPEGPTAPGVDPAGQAGARMEVTVLDLSGTLAAEDALTLAGANLWNLSLALSGYARSGR